VHDAPVSQCHAQSYIIAGGADDGITVFLVLAGGGLLAVDNLADTNAMTLANVSAIAAQSQADGLDIFVASSTEAGLTRLFYDIGQDMDVINGSSGNDTLNAGAGDDVLTDGAGRDTLIGGGGADIFVLAADDQADVITDFEVGADRIDLSDWNNLRSTSQLFLTTTSYGITITYGNETLNLLSNDGQSISTSDLLDTDVVGAARFPAVMVAGTAGPITTPPDLPDRPEADDPTPALVEPYEVYEVWGTGANDSLRGSTGDDIIFGQSGNDRLYGDAGNDLLFGGTGSDQLFGGAGNDILYGGGGRDTFVFRSGRDTITDFTFDVDLITLDDALWDGAQNIAAVIAQSGSIKAGSASLDFGDGNVLTLTGVTDLAALPSHIDII
jgi:serralysin